MAERYDFHGFRIFEFDGEGALLRDPSDMLNTALNHKARVIAIPADRLGDDFFRLKTRIAGEMLGKLTMYKMRVAIIGDISRYVAESDSLRYFVHESNRGSQVWFVSDRQELESRLRGLAD